MIYEDINRNVSLEEMGRFTVIDDKIAKVTGMLAARKMANAGLDVRKIFFELKEIDNDYKTYVRAGNCDNKIVYEKRLAVVNKITEIENLLKTL